MGLGGLGSPAMSQGHQVGPLVVRSQFGSGACRFFAADLLADIFLLSP